jgi:hypothetical protein
MLNDYSIFTIYFTGVLIGFFFFKSRLKGEYRGKGLTLSALVFSISWPLVLLAIPIALAYDKFMEYRVR